MNVVLKSYKDWKPRYIYKMKYWTETVVFGVALNQSSKSEF